jgi:DNA-binding LacI/PurR family transcriptional regulator
MASSVISTRRLIALESKLSTTTVSLVLNGRADAVGIKPQTQQRVWEVAKRLNYTPNPLAVGLNGGRTGTIGLLWSLGGPHTAGAMSRAITLRMQKRDYLVHLADHFNDPAATLKLLTDFARRRVDGIILQSGGRVLENPSILQKVKEFPASLLVGDLPPSAGLAIDHLHHDRIVAYGEAMDHFVRIGRRRPVFLGPQGPGADEKANVFFEHARRAGLEVSEESRIDDRRESDQPLVEWCRNALESRFNGRDFPFDALMCTNDEWAVVAIDFLRRRNLRVPEHVAVVGFNDNALDPYHSPPLASADRRDHAVADAIEEMIFNRLEHPQSPPQRRTIVAHFVWRESAGGGPVPDATSDKQGEMQ